MTVKDMFVSPKKMKSFMDSSMNRILKGKDFTASQIPFILEVGDHEGISPKDLCMVIGVDKGLATRVIRSLIENGLVENKSESSRTYSLYLTAKGREAYDFSKMALERTLHLVLECLDEDETEALKKIMAKIDKRLDELYEY